MNEDQSLISTPGNRRWVTASILLTILWCIVTVSVIGVRGNAANTLHSQIVTGCLSLIPVLFAGLGLPGLIHGAVGIYVGKRDE